MDPVPNENNEFETESSETEEDFDDTDSHYTDVDDDCSESENSLDVSLDVDEDEDGFEIDDSDEEDSEEEDDGDRCLVEITKPYNPITSNDSILETDYDEVSHSDWGNLKAFIMLADGQQIAEWFKQRKISQEAKQNIGKVFSPLNLAARVSSPQIFNFLLGEGFPLNTIIHPFLDAALNHRFDIMQTLLDIGADINVTDAAGTSALHLVARQMTCKPKKIKFLLSRGANIEQKDNSGMTSLHYALLMGSRGTVVTLLRAGASVKERNGKGRPVLHMAVYRGHKMTALLYKAGARPGTSKEHSEIEAAVKCHDVNTVRFLIKRNAPVHISLKTILEVFSLEDEETGNQIIDLLLGAGFRSSADGKTVLGLEDKETQKCVIKKLTSAAFDPRSLQELACFQIRDVFRETAGCILDLAQQLPVPEVLRDYILLKHITEK